MPGALEGNLHWQALLFFNLTLTIPAGLPGLSAKEVSEEGEVCTPGEFKLTIQLEAGKGERRVREATTRKDRAKRWKLRRRKTEETNTEEEFFHGIFQDHVSPQAQR